MITPGDTTVRTSTSLARYAMAVVVLCALSASARAVGFVYVDADDGFLSGVPNISPLSAVESNFSVRDNRWGYRGLGVDATIFESSINADPGDEDSPEITITLNTSNGLVAGSSYDIYVAYWSSAGADWSIKGRLPTGPQTIFNRTGPLPFLPNAVAGTPASSALWATPPAITTEADRVMLLGKIGTATATGGQINVLIDDLPTTAFAPDITPANAVNYRSWLDGVAFIEAGSAIAPTAMVNRDTGQITLNNTTGQNVSVVGYSITSPSGALKPDSWLSISGNYDNGGTFDTDSWNIVAPTTPFPQAVTALTEAEDASGGNSGGALTASGLNFGNAWIRTPAQDLQISLTLSDTRVLTITPQYTGSAVAPGDLNADGDIDLVDFELLRSNLHSNITGMAASQAYALGDMNGDLTINFNDFWAFRTAYDLAHGAGSFNLVTGVPEPATLGLLAISLLAASRLRHRRVQQVRNACNFRGNMSIRPGAWQAVVLLASGIVAACSPSALAQITYVDATPANTMLAAGGAIMTTDNASGNDNIWRLRPLGNGGTIYEAGGDISATGSAEGGNNEDVPRWVTKITGLTPNKTYSTYAYLWSPTGQNWQIQASLVNSTGDLPVHSRLTTTAAAAVDFTGAVPLLTEADRVLYQASIGVGKSSATGELSIYIDDNPAARLGLANAWNSRSWYDGVGFTEASVLTLRVNTTSGAVSIVNGESTSFDISYYEITSSAGSLSLAGWNSLDDKEGGDPVGIGWDEAGGVSNNVLSEIRLAGLTTVAPAATLGLGNAFSAGGTQDLVFSYGLPNGTLQPGFVEYVTGPAPLVGDYNLDGRVDAADYTVWRDTLGQNITPGQGADGNKNGVIDSGDYNEWKTNFGMGSGAGTLAGTSPVPEPTYALIVVGTLLCAAVQRCRKK